MRSFLFVASVLGVSLLASVPMAQAAVVWTGSFETADLSQWTGVLNGDIDGMVYAYPQMEIVGEGSFAGRIELHNDAVWPNGLKRVELQHRPDDARTAEGATTWFAWSFYLPEELPSDPSQQIGYWESVNSYQQMMAFEVSGTDITFSTRRPMNVVQWDGSGVVSAGEWHRIAMGVTWSTDAGQGLVDVWFDGELVVDQASAQTLADDNPHFTQIGLLRGAIEFEDVPIIIIDDAVEGDSLEDVRADDIPGQGGGDSGSSDGGVMTTGPSDSTGDGWIDSTSGNGPDDPTAPLPGTGDDPDATGSGGTSNGEASGDGDGGGCSCRSVGSGSRSLGGAGLMLLGLLGLLGLRRRGS